MKVCSCIWWYCADISYAFLIMGGVRSRKYCASISDMTTTWGLRREVVLRINLPRASIEACRMLWHFSRNGSCGWLRYWGKGYVCREVSSARITSREIKYGNSNSGTFDLQQYHCRSLPYGEWRTDYGGMGSDVQIMAVWEVTYILWRYGKWRHCTDYGGMGSDVQIMAVCEVTYRLWWYGKWRHCTDYGGMGSDVQMIPLQIIAYGEHIILLECQYILFCWMKGTPTRLEVYLR